MLFKLFIDLVLFEMEEFVLFDGFEENGFVGVCRFFIFYLLRINFCFIFEKEEYLFCCWLGVFCGGEGL